MATNLETIEINGLLAELAYLKLESSWFNGYTDEGVKRSIYNKSDVLEFIDITINEKGENDGKGLSGIELERKEIIKSLLDKYEIVAFESTHPTYISGTNYTEGSDFQGMLLKEKGTTNYIAAIRGTDSTTDIFNDVVNIGITNYNNQIEEARDFIYKNIISESITKDQLTIVGHSLGGIHTQQLAYEFQVKGYAYNPFGSKNLINDSLWKSEDYQRFAEENILTLSFRDSGSLNGDFLSNITTEIFSEHIGKVLPIVGDNVGLGGGHSIITLNEQIKKYNQILESFNENTTYLELSKAYTLTSKYINGGYDYVQKIFTELDIYSKTQLQLNILENINYEDIVNSNDKAKLYSLINQIPFTISSSSVDLYENFDISNMSESELNDRGLMYQYIINNTPEEQREYSFINNETKINLIDNSLKKPAIVFGNETSEVLYGKDTDDRIYAGKGDDTIIAGNGNDYIEGGLGNDTIEAGAGINYVDGGEGNDTVSYKTIQSKEGINVNLSLATAQAINSTTTDTLVNIENVIGTKYSDTIYGSSFDVTTLEGEKKIYILEGYDGSDKIYELFDLIDVGISSINLNTSLRDAIDTNITIDEAIEDVLEFKKLVA